MSWRLLSGYVNRIDGLFKGGPKNWFDILARTFAMTHSWSSLRSDLTPIFFLYTGFCLSKMYPNVTCPNGNSRVLGKKFRSLPFGGCFYPPLPAVKNNGLKM